MTFDPTIPAIGNKPIDDIPAINANFVDLDDRLNAISDDGDIVLAAGKKIIGDSGATIDPDDGGDGGIKLAPATGKAIKVATVDGGNIVIDPAGYGEIKKVGGDAFYSLSEESYLNAIIDSAYITTAGGSQIAVGGYYTGGGKNVVFIKNCTATPTVDPVLGGILYVSAGALKYRGSSGSVTNIANA